MALTNATTLADYSAGIGTQGATLTVDATNKRVGVGTDSPAGPEGSLQVGTGITFFGNTGIVSAIGGKFSGDFTVGGVLAFEDVTNIDSVGIITAQSGIKFGASGVGGTITATGQAEFVGIVTALGVNVSGVVTATSFKGDGSALTGVESWNQFDTWLYSGG